MEALFLCVFMKARKSNGKCYCVFLLLMTGGLKNILPYLRIDEENDSLQIQEKRGCIHETGKKNR